MASGSERGDGAQDRLWATVYHDIRIVNGDMHLTPMPAPIYAVGKSSMNGYICKQAKLVPLGTVQALLGHSSSEITRGVYLRSLPRGAREAVEKVESLIIGPKKTQIVENENFGLLANSMSCLEKNGRP